MKRVLLVTHYAPPDLNAESILVWKTIRRLSESHRVTVVTATLDKSARVDNSLTFPDQVQVIRKRSQHAPSRILAKATEKALGVVVDEKYLWTFSGKRFAQACTLHDVIYSRSQPGASHILAWRLKRHLQIPWIAQFSDPWANNPYHLSHTRLRRAFDSSFETRVIQEANLLIFPTSEIQAMYVDAYPGISVKEKSVVLPHHYIPELYKPRPEPVSKKIIDFTYFGDFYGQRSPEPFIAALHVLAKDRPSVLAKMQVCFVGNVEPKFQSTIDMAPILIRQDKMSYFRSLDAMAQSEVLVLVDAPVNGGLNPFLPSKLIDYFGAGRPVLGITNLYGTAANLLRQHHHHVVNPLDVEGIADAITKLVTSVRSDTSPPYEFTTERVVGRLSRLIEQL